MLKFSRVLAIIWMVMTALIAWGQNPNSKVTVSLVDKPLATFITAVEKQTGYTFMHDNSIDRNIKVSVAVNNESLQRVLTKVLDPLSIQYELSNKHILLKKSSKQQSQNHTRLVTGKVLDNNKEPIIGASVILKGTTVGTSTDFDGAFSLNVPSNAVLQASYLGYTTSDVTVNGANKIVIVLKESVNSLDEVVVVGYGTSVKKNLVGAVEQISDKAITNRANPNIARSLQGEITGVNVSMWDGKPTRSTTPTIRGVTNSIGAGGSALVLVDGVESDLGQINPADVESVSVLKDASSAAVYGARGAFGVILVTTKNAKKGEVTVNYNGNVSLKQRTYTPQYITNGLQWTNMYLESWQTYNNKSKDQYPTTIDVAFPFSSQWYEDLQRHEADPTLERIALGDDGLYKYYGNTSWYDMFFKKSTFQTEHSLSVSGGTDIASFYVSGRFFDQDGIYRVGNEYFKKYNLKGKGQIKIRPWLILDENFTFARDDYHQPMVMYGNQLPMRQISRQGYPVTMARNPDGTWTDAAVYTGYAGFAEGTSWDQTDINDVKNTIALTFIPIKDILRVKGDFTYAFNHSDIQRLNCQYTGYTGPESTVTRSSYSQYSNWGRNTTYMSSNIVANFTPKLGRGHTLDVMAGWNIEDKSYRNILTRRRGVLYPDYPSFTLMDGDYYLTEKSGYDWGFVGIFGRVSYNYLGKYLAEVSGRYDGTSKFPLNQQWGFFPSASLGWRISEEHFMQPTRSWLDNFKIRASVGTLGNGLVSAYKYLSSMTIEKSSYLFNGNTSNYTTAPALIPDGLTWEKATTYDIGADMDFFNGRLNFVGDYYQKYTTDMYTVGPTLPAVLGSSAPKGNNADLKTKGWEVSLGWKDSFGLAGKNFSYNAKVMLWDSRSWITKFYNATGNINNYYKGMELGDIWGFQVEGLFKDTEDIMHHADQSWFTGIAANGGGFLPGDLKFKDVDKSDAIDKGSQTLSNHGDLTVIGNTSPRFQYGINLGTNWNGIGVSVFFQGVGKQDWYPARESALFWGQYGRAYESAYKMHLSDRWTEENPDVNAYWPRYRGYQATVAAGTMSTPNDRYLQNVGYLRLKNLTVDYSLPKNWMKKIGLKDLRVYLTGENLLTFSQLFKVTKNFDPEGINSGDTDFNYTSGSDSAGDGYGYPVMKSFTLGLNLTF